MAGKLTELSIVRAAAAIVVAAVVGAGRVVAAVAAAAIYRLVYSYGSLYGIRLTSTLIY